MTDTVYSDVNKTAEYFGVSIHTIRKWVKEGKSARVYATVGFEVRTRNRSWSESWAEMEAVGGSWRP